MGEGSSKGILKLTANSKTFQGNIISELGKRNAGNRKSENEEQMESEVRKSVNDVLLKQTVQFPSQCTRVCRKLVLQNEEKVAHDD